MTSLSLSPDIDGRIFVVGVPRSGTTLVQSLLAAHSRMTSFTESHLFDRHFKLLPWSSSPILTSSPEPRLREFLAENGEEPPAAASWFATGSQGALRAGLRLPLQTRQVARQLLRVLDELALRRGRAYWVEKTPRHLRYIPFLERIGGPEPRMRFVHVIRDGLEVVASLREASQSWERPYDVASCVRRWNADVGFSLRRITGPNDQFVFYEELTARPEATLRRLLSALGLGWEAEILARYAGVSDRLVTKQEGAWKANVGRGIRHSDASQRRLTEEQRRRADRSLRHGLYDELRRRAGGLSAEEGSVHE